MIDGDEYNRIRSKVMQSIDLSGNIEDFFTSNILLKVLKRVTLQLGEKHTFTQYFIEGIKKGIKKNLF